MYEECQQTSMIAPISFIKKLIQVQSLCLSNQSFDTVQYCELCKPTQWYMVGDLVWNDTCIHKMNDHQMYPSEQFINIIHHLIIIDNFITNPPLLSNRLKYTFLSYNQIIILDDIRKSGQESVYVSDDQFVSSEHMGLLNSKYGYIHDIQLLTSFRTDPKDPSILLPMNNRSMLKASYLFHTHPRDIRRIKQNILYEFPSIADIINFMKFYSLGQVESSVVIAPEGVYNIRPIKYVDEYNYKHIQVNYLTNLLMNIEKKAIQYYHDKLELFNDVDQMIQYAGQNSTFIKMYNDILEQYNIFIEYYPRTKINNQWVVGSIMLPSYRFIEH